MKRLAVLCCILLTMGATSALASMSGTLYSNNGGDYDLLDTSGGLVGINAVVGSLSWTVDQLDGGLWDYTYIYTPYTLNKNRGIGSFNIEFGAQPTDLAWDYTYVSAAYPITSEPDMYDATTDGTLTTIDKTMYTSWLNAADPTATNVDVTTTFEGLTWLVDTSDPKGCETMTLHFTTSLAPTWGNIYMDGYNNTSNNGYGMLRNTNYDIAPIGAFVYDAAFAYATSDFVGWIATPGVASTVPVPASLLLFGSGLGGLFIFKRRNQACC